MGKVPQLGPYNDHDLNQVWMIEYIKEKKLHELVHAQSTLVLESTFKSCKLVFGNWGTGQHYVVKHYENTSDPNIFVFRDKDNPNAYVYADRDGIIQLGEKKEDDPEIRWVLRIA